MSYIDTVSLNFVIRLVNLSGAQSLCSSLGLQNTVATHSAYLSKLQTITKPPQNTASVLALIYFTCVFGLSVLMNSSFFPDLCFILQLYIHYAGEHQSQPIHGYQTESYISEGEGLFMSRSGTKYADYNTSHCFLLQYDCRLGAKQCYCQTVWLFRFTASWLTVVALII